jgi:hypothetical protein
MHESAFPFRVVVFPRPCRQLDLARQIMENKAPLSCFRSPGKARLE